MGFTPFSHEHVGDLVADSAADLYLFSSDYPHLEGGRNPYGRFQNTTQNLSEETLNKFYRLNFEDLMGI